MDRLRAGAELEDFKRDVNLVQFAKAQGYELVKHKSCSASKYLRHPSGDKIVVARSRSDEHWIYFSLQDQRDQGSVVDFIQHREARADLGRVRRILRDWLGRPNLDPPSPQDFVTPTERNRVAVTAAYEAAEVVRNLRYLNERGLRPSTLSHPQFRDTWRREPKYGNALFVHRDELGISGFEKKNRNFTGFAGGGEKTFWFSTPVAPVERLVVTESAIDAMSHFQLHPQERARYMSFGGQFSPRQLQLLKQAAAKLPSSGEVVVAVDQDAAGDHFHQRIQAGLAGHQVLVRRDSPERPGQDWNDVLKAREHAFIAELPPRRARARKVIDRGLDR